MCGICENDPCTCQRSLVVATDWINQTCSSPGCTVVIRSRVGKQPSVPVCKWCQEGNTQYRKTESVQRSHTGPVMTREEFGRDLYEAIKLQAGIETAKQKAELMRAKGLKNELSDTEQWIAAAEQHLGGLLDRGTINPADVRRILGIQSRALVLV